ncbi:MAG: helix-turn-helix domain-containing protein [Tenacibaculum sp.]
MNLLQDKHKKNSVYFSKYAELKTYEIKNCTKKVCLKFNFPIIISSIRGKNNIYFKDTSFFDFFSGQSVVVPSNTEVLLNFPLATKKNPNHYSTLAISEAKIKEMAYLYYKKNTYEDKVKKWNLNDSYLHLINNTEISQLINKLITSFTQGNKRDKLLVDIMIQELIIRLLQTKASSIILLKTNTTTTDTRIEQAIRFIKENMTHKNITVDILAKRACMSISHFHKQFKKTMGMSPICYINAERIKFSKKLIKESKNSKMFEIAFKSGFNSTSYFNRQFKKIELTSPKQFKNSFIT